MGKSVDTLLSKYSIDDLSKISEYLIPTIDTLINIADPKVLNKINAATNALKEINPEDIEEYSIWRLMRQMNKPEVKKSIGFVLAFLQNITKTENI
jgi:uncharacterized protein YjgD (DUF1641 family)